MNFLLQYTRRAVIRFCWVIGLCGAGLCVADNAAAQAQPAGAGNDSYSRYVTPGQCEQAGVRLSMQYWRDKRPDTVVYAPTTDSVPASVITSVRACLTRFSVDKVAEQQLLNLAQAHLWAQQDDQAQQALTRLLSSSSPQDPDQRGWTLMLIVKSLLDAKPARAELARQYLAQLDALGDTVATWRMFGHSIVSEYAMSVYDLQAAESEAREALRASSVMGKPDRLDLAGEILNAYEHLAEPVAHIANDNTHALAVFDSAAKDLFPLRGPGTWVGRLVPNRGIGFQVPVYDEDGRLVSGNAKPIDPGAIALARLKANWGQKRNPFTLFGERAAPLHVDRWFDAMNDSTSSELRPQRGKVSLVVFVNPNCNPRICFPIYASIRRLESQFTPLGIDVILVSQVAGWFRNKLVDADEEAKLTADYYQDFLEIPATVGVEFRQLSKRERDGRVMRPATENLKNYMRNRTVVLVKKDGTIGVSSELTPRREMTWRAILEDAVNE